MNQRHSPHGNDREPRLNAPNRWLPVAAGFALFLLGAFGLIVVAPYSGNPAFSSFVTAPQVTPSASVGPTPADQVRSNPPPQADAGRQGSGEDPTATMETETEEPPEATPEPTAAQQDPTATSVPATSVPATPTQDAPVLAASTGDDSVGELDDPPTSTPVPPTNTPVPPTNTPVPPTSTPVPPTSTPVPPTATPTPKPEFLPDSRENAPADPDKPVSAFVDDERKQPTPQSSAPEGAGSNPIHRSPGNR